MHLEEFEKDAKDNDAVIKRIKTSASIVEIQFSKLLQWGKQVREKFDADNASHLMDSSSNPALIRTLQSQAQELVKVKHTVNVLKRQNQDQLNEVLTCRNELRAIRSDMARYDLDPPHAEECTRTLYLTQVISNLFAVCLTF